MNFLYLFVFIPELQHNVTNEPDGKVINIFNFVTISDFEFDQFGLKSENLDFPELLEIVSCELLKQRMKESSILAEKFGLVEIKMDQFPD